MIMNRYNIFYSMAIVLAFIAFSCTHLPRPLEILDKSDESIDWGTNPPSYSDMAKHTISGKQPFEWWYFDGHLDSGETFVGTFHDPNFVSGKPGVTFTLYKTDWTSETYSADLKNGELQVSKHDINIKSPAGYVRRHDENTFLAGWSFEGIKVDLKLTTLAPGWLPGYGNSADLDTIDFFWAVHQGKCLVEGTIIKNGVPRQVKGEGYADHNWGRKPLNEIVRSWVWGRILAGDYTIIYADVNYRDPAFNQARPLYIAKGETIIVGSGSPTILQQNFDMHPALQRYYPRQIDIDYTSGAIAAHISISFKALVENVDLLTVSGQNKFSQWFARTFVARPTYFRIMADYAGTITENGVQTPISGKCLYEVMGLE